MRRFLTAGALMTAVALAAATAASAAVPSPSYQLGGMAFGSTFFGTGVGSAGDRGTWQANVSADPATGSISGGSFSLRSNNRSTLTGSFTGGGMSVTSAAPGCGRQQFAVSASMSSSNGPLLFTGTLSTFRVSFRGTCTTLFATVQGSLAPAPDPGGGGGGDL
jgi:opacity protein-like surface antigen